MFKTLFLVVFLSGAAFQARAEWSFYLVDTYGFTPAIGLDNSGNPRIVYSRDSWLKYGTFYDTYWNDENIYQPVYGSCGWPGLVFDEQGAPHVSFSGGGWICYAVMNPEDRSWEVEDFTHSLFGTWTSIALTPEGYPCIAWYSSEEDLRFVSWNGSTWTQETVDQSADVGACNSIAVDADGVVHVAYCEFQPNVAVRYAQRKTAGGWETVVVDASMTSEPTGTSLALDGNGYPRMSYFTDGEVRYASWDGSSWTIQTVYATDTGAHTYVTSLALDLFGYPHIAHCGAGGDSLMYSVNQGGGWLTESIYTLSEEAAGDPDLILDELARPHIVFQSGETGWKLYYAHNDQPSGVDWEGPPAGTAALRVSPAPFTSSLTIAFTLSADSKVELKVFDMSGRVMSVIQPGHLTTGDHTIVWRPDSSLPSGQYIVVFLAREVRASARVVFLRQPLLR